jgi:cytoskeleton protein RodZ
MASLGQSLREEREARNISLEEIASATKIVPRYLEALEADRLDLMPGVFFIKGIIRTYAKAIGLDPEEVVKGCWRLPRRPKGSFPSAPSRRRSLPTTFRSSPRPPRSRRRSAPLRPRPFRKGRSRGSFSRKPLPGRGVFR